MRTSLSHRIFLTNLPLSSVHSHSVPPSSTITHICLLFPSFLCVIFSFLKISLRTLLCPSFSVSHRFYFSSRSQSSCDWSAHLFCIRVPEEQTLALTLIKLMTVIKNHSSIIKTEDVSNGKRDILFGSPVIFSLSHNTHTLTHMCVLLRT